MDKVVWKYILLAFITFIAGAVSQQELAIILTMNPSNNGGKVIRGSSVEFTCTVDINILGPRTIDWYMRQGVNRYQLSTGGSYRYSHLTVAPRYHLTKVPQTSSVVIYKLTITNVQIEDSGIIECAAEKPSTRKASQVLAVCADINSQVCDCTIRSGWTSPDCIYTADTDEGFERATIGLAVCLVITILYATFTTAVVIYDCRHKLKEQRLKEAEREASLAQSTAVISSQTASTSAMKPRTAAGVTVVSSRPAVRFNDSSQSQQKNDISC